MNADADWGIFGTFPLEEEGSPVILTTCECGSSVTMGKDDHWTYHSDYCPLHDQRTFENYKQNRKD